MTSTETTKGRRRGAELEREIYAAAFSELMEKGCGQFSIEGVAHASATSKASIYRRWMDREELLLDTIDFYFPPIVRPTPIGEPFALLQLALEEVVAFFNTDLGHIAYNLLIESRRSKRFSEIFDRAIAEPRREYFRRIMVENYVGDGLDTPDLIRVANVSSSLLIHNVFVNAIPVNIAVAREIVEEIAKPLAAGIEKLNREAKEQGEGEEKG
ncbi:MAG: TetR/AcrR family transcriptional regulator [Actinomycetota bacterium]|nr:TetR/AcrR family transcriptional regulator [Actinomycetota bacterium]